MTTIEQVIRLGQVSTFQPIPRPGVVVLTQAAKDAQRKAQLERIKETEAARALTPRQPTTPLEIEARKRMTTYRAENTFQSNRRRFESQLSTMPLELRLKVRELMKAHDSYENLPGYSAFAAGRITVKEMRAGLEAQYERLKAYELAQRDARDAASDARDDLIDQGIDATKRAKDILQIESRQRVSLTRQAARDKANEKKAAEKAAADQLKAERNARLKVERDKRDAAFEIERAAHPFQEGSPPISAAIKIVAEKMGIAPGYISLVDYLKFRYLVYAQAKKERGRFYYYKGGRDNKYWYSVSKGYVTAQLTREGYFALPKQAIPRPAPPARATRTVSASDPMIAEAILQALAESGLVSGSQIDIDAFERMVTAKATTLTRTTGKTARPIDIQSAVRSRVITSLRGMAM